MNEDYIKGNVVKLLFESSTGYKVGLFKVKEASGDDVVPYLNKTITFTGNFMPLNNELTYKFVGKITHHARFGVQFNVFSYESVIPETKNGIVMYLSSGIFKGIGPKTAKLIVDTFKEDTIDEIKNGNPILSKIKGMNEKKARELTNKILEYDKDQELILEFSKLGFTMEECLKIVNKYKDRCFDIIKNNIYVLESDINFLKLDKIFLKFHEENEGVRIDALKYCIQSLCYKQGDTLVDKETLFLEVNKFFSDMIDSKVFLSHIDDLIEIGYVTEVYDLVTLTEFYEIESNIASSINHLIGVKNNLKEDVILREISNYERDNGVVFNDDQKVAIKGSLINNLFIITGGPGTGKTTIIKAVVDIYERLDESIELKDITLLAPTGRAAKRIQESVHRKASTIHKFLKWNKETKEFNVNRFNPCDTKLVIIDEFSMVDNSLFNSLLDGLVSNIKLILVGDANQLPSIAPGNILSDMLGISIVPRKELSTVYRTSEDSYIIPLAQDIKNRKVFSHFPNVYEDFKFISSPDVLIKKYIIDICEKAKSKNLDIEDFQVLVPMYKGENGIDSINRIMQSIFNKKDVSKREIVIRDIVYREGDKVIQLVNDVDNNIYNGDVGYIRRIIDGSKSMIEIDYNGNVVMYNKGKFDEFTHAYAISVHKSQGSEYANVIVVIPSNMKRMLYNKLLYTAVTRAKKGLVVIGSVDSFNFAVHQDYSENRNTSLKTFF